MNKTTSFTLSRNSAAKLVCALSDGTNHIGVVPVRTFPLAAPMENLSLVNSEGHEIAWIVQLKDLSADTQQLLQEELAKREFMPVIHKIDDVSSFATPSTWTVSTDRGQTRLLLKGEEDIRRLPDSGLLISDSHGVIYHIPDRKALDRHSRKILSRFL